jgi:hypothetical protein
MPAIGFRNWNAIRDKRNDLVHEFGLEKRGWKDLLTWIVLKQGVEPMGQRFGYMFS